MKIYVVGTDGSETAARAAERAGELALGTGASVHVVSASPGAGAARASAASGPTSSSSAA